ncbi:hypothetical protein EFR00_20960 [Rhizobium sophoriradicis]|nr:hypothetical protein EFR00_20960 [Rhizobium sophoriradicis]
MDSRLKAWNDGGWRCCRQTSR